VPLCVKVWGIFEERKADDGGPVPAGAPFMGDNPFKRQQAGNAEAVRGGKDIEH
jgi:hypothetical protein